MHLRIGVDIDGVVCELHQPLLDRLKIKYGNIKTKREDIIKWESEVILPDGRTVPLIDEIHEALNDWEFATNLPQIANAKKGLEKLEALGCKVIFVTSRSGKLSFTTTDWIRKNFGDHDVRFSNDKKNGGEIDILIDDNPQFLINFVNDSGFISHPCLGILFVQPWNERVALEEHKYEIARVGDWPSAVALIRGIQRLGLKAQPHEMGY